LNTPTRAATRANPCPVCQGVDGCSITGDGLILCRRREGEQIGFRCLGPAHKEPAWCMYRHEDDHRHAEANGRLPSANGDHHKPPAIDWPAKAASHARNLTPERRQELAAAMSLPEWVLGEIQIGYCDVGPHKGDDGQPLGPCWTFPETDAARNVIGIVCRYRSGAKKAWPGSRRGLTLPASLLADRDGPVLLVEGASDVLAATAMFIAAIGRPSNTGGVDLLADVLRDLPSDRLIITMGECDGKSDGQWPGRDGAVKTAAALTAKLGRPIEWALPPDAAKDVRSWAIAKKLDWMDGCSDAGEELLRRLTLHDASDDPSGQMVSPNGKAPSQNGMVVAVPERCYRPTWLSSREFNVRDYRPEWAVKNLIVRNQPLVVGAPRKSMKTSLMCELSISIGSATPFLGQFVVPNRLLTAVVSGESGEFTLQETARRICAEKGISLDDVECLWDFQLPQLANSSDLAALALSIQELGIKVLVLDPLYLCLLSGVDAKNLSAANLFDMGPLLLGVGRACLDVGCTPCLVHHARKNLNNPNEPMDLEDLAFAGIQEFARQWILLSRREPYQPGTGQHKLWMTAGGSIGHGGTWAINIEEGIIDEHFRGRKWETAVIPLTEVIQAKKEAQKTKANDRTEVKEVGWEAKLLQALDAKAGKDGIAGRNVVRSAAGLSSQAMYRAAFRLQQKGTIEDAKAKVPSGKNGGKKTVPGIRRKVTAGERENTAGELSLPESSQREGGEAL